MKKIILWAVTIGKKPKDMPYVAYRHEDLTFSNLAVFEKKKEAEAMMNKCLSPQNKTDICVKKFKEV